MKNLIINADGFGLTSGTNRAIFEVLGRGFVRSVSVNTTFKAVEDVKRLQEDFPHISIGVHLNLSVGPSILSQKEIPSLVKDNGDFFGEGFVSRIRSGRIDPEHIRKELRAQIQGPVDRNINITHWDSHQNRHLYTNFFISAIEIAKEFNIEASRTYDYYLVMPPGLRNFLLSKYYLNHPRQVITHLIAAKKTSQVRNAGFWVPDKRIILNGLGNNSVYEKISYHRMLCTLPEGTGFLEVHPGYPDDSLKAISNMTETRDLERLLLLNNDWTTVANDNGVNITNFFT